MTQRPDLNQLSADQLRALAMELLERVESKDRVLAHRDAVIEKLTHEIAILKRHKFARRSEQLDGHQGLLLEELIDSDIAAIEAELAELAESLPPDTKTKQQPKRAPLPSELPRTLIHHEPEATQCRCGCQLKRIGEDVSEKLDYVPGVFTVERHIRGKWACNQCGTLTQAPVPAQVIDKGIPTSGLLAQVLVAKYAERCSRQAGRRGRRHSMIGLTKRILNSLPASGCRRWSARMLISVWKHQIGTFRTTAGCFWNLRAVSV